MNSLTSMSSRRGLPRAGALACFVAVTVAQACRAQATFTPMGPPPSPWIYWLPITSVTNEGVVIGSMIDSNGERDVFTWSVAAGYQSLPDLTPMGKTNAGAASPDGRFIPGASKRENGEFAPVIWVDGQGPFVLPGAPVDVSAKAWGVSWDGTIVGGELFTPGVIAEGFLSSPTHGFEALGVPPGANYTCAGQLPQYGETVLCAIIWGQLGGAQEGARWTRENGWEPLGDLPGGAFFSNLGLCSRDGRVGAGRGSIPEGTRAARWVEATGWMNLSSGPTPKETGLTAMGISGDGWVVVGRGVPEATGNHAFIWNLIDGTRVLQDVLKDEYGVVLPSGWTKLRQAEAISDNGRFIAGTALNAQGKQEGWLVELPPFCYADCDRSSGKGNLDVFDFLCFVNKFNAKEPYGNCDNDGKFDVFDFLCFVNQFNAGCGQ